MKNLLQKFQDSLKEFKKVRCLVLCGLMAALSIVLSWLNPIKAGTYIRIGFSGIPNRIVDFLFGPIVGCIYGGTLDVVKFFLNPSGGAFFFGFTLNAMLAGLIYGTAFYKHPVSWKRVLIAEFIVKLFVNCILGTLWISITAGTPFMAIAPLRCLKNLIMWPIDTVIIYAALLFISKIKNRFGY